MHASETTTLRTALITADWPGIARQLHDNGYALLPNLLPDALCETLKQAYAAPQGYRKTVMMERHRFGLGEYKYFQYPLPPALQTIREEVYPHLVPVANAWMEALHLPDRFPATLEALLEQCRAHDQHKPTPLILKYGAGGFNTLHQDLYGEVYFPLQTVFFLSAPGPDYTGGEFVLTQQTPRAQSKAIVLTPGKGDMLIFTTNFRPVKGSKGYYRASMRHGVSEVHRGERYTLGVIFHDAVS
ncbi:2OG-Fe(II) oxygenase [Fulvivirgaceae bacterium PWU5]|uniref:2OG-Fe(II) oxygenase n=1 Tax=Dawidia cretensis TaxID=2782350 RepID=A0AAP2E4M0_9BACT|nr:2OG-Fe(II) oxygenase [Dawidia cretensis]MBT1711649.1 2OG-Fe(II) oxygenase [Dawidia cretensis]